MKTNIYIYQLFGIMLLLCGYLFSNIPDSLSVMSFNLQSNSVFSAASDNIADNAISYEVKVSSTHHSRHRSNVQKHISLDILMPVKPAFFVQAPLTVRYNTPLTKEYTYLFFEEINPPPPRA